MSTSEKVKVPFRHKRWLGLPAPIVVGILAVLLVAGAAIAAVMLRARATVDGTVADNQLRWVDGYTLDVKDGIGAVQVNYPDPLATPLAVGETRHFPPQGVDRLGLTIVDALPTGHFDLCVKVGVPVALANGSLQVVGIDLGNPDVYTATLSDQGCQTPGFRDVDIPFFAYPGVVLDGGQVNEDEHPGRRAWVAHIVVTFNEDAPIGAFGSADLLDGLKVQTIS